MRLLKQTYINSSRTCTILDLTIADCNGILLHKTIALDNITGETIPCPVHTNNDSWHLIDSVEENDQEIYNIPFEIARMTDIYTFNGEPFQQFVHALKDGSHDPLEDVPYTLEFGNISLEMIIDDETDPRYYYIVCIQADDTWQYYNQIPILVDLDIKDIEREMYNILLHQAELCNLSIFNSN